MDYAPTPPTEMPVRGRGLSLVDFNSSPGRQDERGMGAARGLITPGYRDGLELASKASNQGRPQIYPPKADN